MGIYLPGAGTLAYAIWSGAGISHSGGIPPDFYHHMRMWDCLFCSCCLSVPHCVSLPLCSSLCLCPSYLSDECGFFKFLVVTLPYSLIFWKFWVYLFGGLGVILCVVVWGGKACLPMPPTWLEVRKQILKMKRTSVASETIANSLTCIMLVAHREKKRE